MALGPAIMGLQRGRRERPNYLRRGFSGDGHSYRKRRTLNSLCEAADPTVASLIVDSLQLKRHLEGDRHVIGAAAGRGLP